MDSIKSFTGKFLFPVFLFLSSILFGCSDNNVPTTPNYPPNTFCDVTGKFDMHYKGQGTIYGLNNPFGITVNSFFKDSTGKIFYLGINVYFRDGKYKTGTFPFLGKADSTISDYAVAFFETGEGSNKQTFISYSGDVRVDEISLTRFKGSFSFLSKDKNGNNVAIKNGTFDIINQ